MGKCQVCERQEIFEFKDFRMNYVVRTWLENQEHLPDVSDFYSLFQIETPARKIDIQDMHNW